MSWEMMDSRLAEYVDALVPERPAELREMEEEAKRTRFPIIGPAAGQLCYLVARLIGARKVFELGSGYGYSTAWFARAVAENGGGTVDHVVWDEGLSQRARGHLERLGYGDIVRYTVGEAVEALRESGDGPFDLIFNDIDKHAYPDSLAVIESRLRPGGVLIIDNMIWHGALFDAEDHSRDTEGVREVTRRITGSPDWISSLVPLRDGVIVAMKR
jgi:caffeoyl-CoA O-methyltransferase